MASAPPPSAAKLYRPNKYVSLPAELDPDTYDTSPEKLRAEAERLAIRSRLKRQYQLQLNNPKPPAVIENPALIRWAFAKSQNVYPTFRPTPKTSFLGAVYGLGPLIFWFFVLKTDRDRKEKRIQEGKVKRPFSVFF
ncbi:PREDICTED: NADH dehydrogenase [ubiquinone] 1 beta subcomplex subunit 4 [Pseudopodoces humilis]|uniref:NADH dehydrogenase [ubiquinone] 1 beta subcomplex subunit 4 n=1 Tax=Pseudopodoces humilis TaxID=181119 RepID=UPI000395B7BF|nr:PREDICTED: NADH dehydrogenase [ubiquinone] 1 beta subcomplex subunit 4 [Pseudopodoces humilis]